jgi:arylsulfatase A-like enzyme
MSVAFKKPHVVLLIVVDSLRADRMSCYGYRLKTTPFLDSRLHEFIKFQWAFSTCSYTVPAITSILTGLYPQNHSLGLYHTTSLYSRKLDNDKDIMVQEVLRVNGYKTYAIFGAPVLNSYLGITAGFDKVYECEKRERRPYYETTAILKNIIDNIEENTFIFAHYFDVHKPYIYGYKENKFLEADYPSVSLFNSLSVKPFAVDSAANLYNHIDSKIYQSSYDSSILIVDREIGSIIDFLLKREFYENSTIIITADHGELMGEDNYYCHHFLNLHPVLIRIPLLIKLPAYFQLRGCSFIYPVSSVSIFKTILDSCGINSVIKTDAESLINCLRRNNIRRSGEVLVANHPLQYALIRRRKEMIKIYLFLLPISKKLKKLSDFVYSAIFKYDAKSAKLESRSLPLIYKGFRERKDTLNILMVHNIIQIAIGWPLYGILSAYRLRNLYFLIKNIIHMISSLLLRCIQDEVLTKNY